MHDEIRTSTNLISQLNALIAELEAFGDYEDVFDLVMELRDDRRDEQDKVVDFNRLIVVAEEKIHGKEIDLEMLEAEVAVGCAIGYGFCLAVVNLLMEQVSNLFLLTLALVLCRETQAIDDQDPLVNYDNDNENDALGYQSEEYFNERYFDVDLTVRKLVMNRLGQLLRNFRRKLRQTYILPNQNTLSKLNEVLAKYSAILQAEEWVNFVKYKATEEYKVKSAAAKMAHQKKEIEPDEEPARSTLWLKGRVNKDEEYPDDEIRSVGDKLKETEDKIKEGTLKVDHGTDAMTVVLGKERGGYARGVGCGVTYKRYFDLPQSKQASDERILLLQSQLDNVSSVDINPINSSADEDAGTKIHGCENDASIQKSNGLATLEKEMETRITCIPDVGNCGFKTLNDAVGGFFAWPKDQVVFNPKETPPSTIQMNVENKTAPKLQTKRKNVYFSSDAMQRQAKNKRNP
nr:hypothetical protein [Tanacetum cinerariifolium]